MTAITDAELDAADELLRRTLGAPDPSDADLAALDAIVEGSGLSRLCTAGAETPGPSQKRWAVRRAVCDLYGLAEEFAWVLGCEPSDIDVFAGRLSDLVNNDAEGLTERTEAAAVLLTELTEFLAQRCAAGLATAPATWAPIAVGIAVTVRSWPLEA